MGIIPWRHVRRETMKAEIISIGTELLLGHVVNTDAAIVAAELASLGVDVTNMQTVGDNMGRLKEAFAQAAKRSDIIVTTGCLGPTDDDLTRDAVAEFTGRPLVRDDSALATLKEYFGEMELGKNQLKQALVPQGSSIFPNAHGTAPGFASPFDGDKVIISLPGPPGELKPMLESGVREFIASREKSAIVSTIVRTFGIGEGTAAGRISDLMALSNPTCAPYASNGEMFVKITAKAADAETARSLAAPVVRKVCDRLGDFVYGEDVASLESVVVSALVRTRRIVTTAESCTGGLLAKRITDQPGSSAVFRVGVVTYANSAKERLLEIPRDTLMEYGAVSPQVARAMAENALRLNSGNYGIGITGIAGPDGGTPEKPVGLVYIALAWDGGCETREMRPQGRYPGREWIRNRAASHALDLLRRHLSGIPLTLPPC